MGNVKLSLNLKISSILYVSDKGPQDYYKNLLPFNQSKNLGKSIPRWTKDTALLNYFTSVKLGHRKFHFLSPGEHCGKYPMMVIVWHIF